MANEIINGQTLTIRITNNIDVSTATNIIKYWKPNGETGTLTNLTAESAYIYSKKFVITGVGIWKFILHSTFPSGDINKSKPITIEVYEEGEIIK